MLFRSNAKNYTTIPIVASVYDKDGSPILDNYNTTASAPDSSCQNLHSGCQNIHLNVTVPDGRNNEYSVKLSFLNNGNFFSNNDDFRVRDSRFPTNNSYNNYNYSNYSSCYYSCSNSSSSYNNDYSYNTNYNYNANDTFSYGGYSSTYDYSYNNSSYNDNYNYGYNSYCIYDCNN